MTRLALLAAVLLCACSSGPPQPDWQLASHAAMGHYQLFYLKGDTRSAEAEFARAKSEVSSAGRPALVARAELVRFAVRTASLEFDDCPGFEALRAEAGPEELAYADYLAGRAARTAEETPVSRLVSYGVRFKGGQITPSEIGAAVELSSEQGWRRPLLAWLGVQEKRAEAAGDNDALARIRRRIALVSGKS